MPVQTYGAADAQVVESNREDGAGNAAREDEALLGANATAKQPLREGHATITSSVGNLANTIIGSGEHRSHGCIVACHSDSHE